MLPAEPKLVALVDDQLDLGPTDRLKALLGSRWPGCRDALRAAAAVGELGVLVGPVAAALRGAPQRPGDGRVDLLIAADDREQVSDRLLEHGAWPDGIERSADAAGSERRERWQADRGVLSVRELPTGARNICAIRDRALPVMLNQDAAGLVRVALVEDLATIAASSPWSEDGIYLPGLRAVLASGRYSTRHPRGRVTATGVSIPDAQHRELLRVLTSHKVDFVLVGGVALQVHGISGATRDVDVTISVDEPNGDPDRGRPAAAPRRAVTRRGTWQRVPHLPRADRDHAQHRWRRRLPSLDVARHVDRARARTRHAGRLSARRLISSSIFRSMTKWGSSSNIA